MTARASLREICAHGKRSASAPAATSSRTQGVRARRASLSGSGFANLARAGLHHKSRRRDLRAQHTHRVSTSSPHTESESILFPNKAWLCEGKGGRKRRSAAASPSSAPPKRVRQNAKMYFILFLEMASVLLVPSPSALPRHPKS